MDVTAILTATQAVDPELRSAAEQQVYAMQASDPIGLMDLLARELATEGKPTSTRQLAGLLMKNVVHSRKEGPELDAKRAVWISGNAAQKETVRACTLEGICSAHPEIRQTSAQVIGILAAIDLPRKEWGGLIDTLVGHVRGDGNNEHRQGALLALGFSCEEIHPDGLETAEVNRILTAVAYGSRVEEADNDVRLAALSSLHNALQFAAANFRNPYERTYVMHLITTAAKCTTDVRVQLEAFECLVEIASTYYEAIEEQMQEMFSLTKAAIEGADDRLRMQGFEFWSTICEVEESDDSTFDNRRYAEQAAPHIVPLILPCIGKGADQQADYLDEDEEWDSVASARVALKRMASAVGNPIFPLTVPFIQAHIGSGEWRLREAALFAMGSVLEGPGMEAAGPLAQQGLPALLPAASDPNPHVRDSALYTLAAVMEFTLNADNPAPVVSTDNVESILRLLVERLQDPSPSVAEKAAEAVQHLAVGCGGVAEAGAGPYLLSPFFEQIVHPLLQAAERPDAAASQVQRCCYEALNELVLNSRPEDAAQVLQLLPVVLNKLTALASAMDGDSRRQLQGLLCGLLQVVVSQVCEVEESRAVVLGEVGSVLQLLLSLMGAGPSPHPLLALSSLIVAMGPAFAPHLPAFLPHIIAAINATADVDCVAVAAGRVQDLATALEGAIGPYVELLVGALAAAVQTPRLPPFAAAAALAALGDLCMASGPLFLPYLPHALALMANAAEYSVSSDCARNVFSEDRAVLINAIAEGYATLLQGSKDQGAMLAVLLPHAPKVYEFLGKAYRDIDRDEAITLSVVGCVGDLADVLGRQVEVLFRTPPHWAKDLITECMQEEEEEQLKNTAVFAKECIVRACGVSTSTT